MKLLPAQAKAIDKLRHYKVGALFMDPGTGKTRAAYELVKSVPGIDYVLYLAPYQGINTEDYAESIPAEVDRCGGFPMPHDFIGIESLSQSDRIYLNIRSKLEISHKPFIIVDEGLKIKNGDAIRSARVLDLSILADYKLILNGTPLSRNLLDLHTQMEFLSPKILNMGMTQFKNTFCEYLKITKRLGHRSMTKEFIVAYHNVDSLYSMISPFVFESQLSLSIGVQNHDLTYSLTDDEFQKHKEIKEKYLDDDAMEMRNNNIFLEITAKLRHNYSLSPEKFAIVDGIIKRHGADNVLIYAFFINSQSELRKRFPGVRIMSLQKHTFALNLQAYSVIVFWDKTWDFAQRDQIIPRIVRQGQDKDCFIYDLTNQTGLDSLINQNIDKKGRLLRRFKQLSNKEIKAIL